MGGEGMKITIDVKHNIGDEVIIKHINVKGYVTGIIIRDNKSIEYEVSYYLGDNFMYTLLSDYQIT
jgi:hypothetical protein